MAIDQSIHDREVRPHHQPPLPTADPDTLYRMKLEMLATFNRPLALAFQKSVYHGLLVPLDAVIGYESSRRYAIQRLNRVANEGNLTDVYSRIQAVRITATRMEDILFQHLSNDRSPMTTIIAMIEHAVMEIRNVAYFYNPADTTQQL